VETVPVLKEEPVSQTGPQLGSIGKGPEVKVMVFEGPPQSFDKDIVLDASATVHADNDLIILEYLGKGVTGELGALVGVEDFRTPVEHDGFLEGLESAPHTYIPAM